MINQLLPPPKMTDANLPHKPLAHHLQKHFLTPQPNPLLKEIPTHNAEGKTQYHENGKNGHQHHEYALSHFHFAQLGYFAPQQRVVDFFLPLLDVCTILLMTDFTGGQANSDSI